MHSSTLTANLFRWKPRGLHLKCPIFLSDLTKFEFFSHRFFVEVPNIKFYGNPFSGSRADTWWIDEE